VLLLASKHGTPAAATVPLQVVHVKAPVVHHAARPVQPRLQLDPNLPTAVRQKLERTREVVAFVYTGASADDRALLQEARAGARAARVAFVPLNVMDERVAESVFGWASSTADPQVIVVRRPGTIVFQTENPVDRDTVAQAAAGAR
jgi:hypothetical protein